MGKVVFIFWLMRKNRTMQQVDTQQSISATHKSRRSAIHAGNMWSTVEPIYPLIMYPHAWRRRWRRRHPDLFGLCASYIYGWIGVGEEQSTSDNAESAAAEMDTLISDLANAKDGEALIFRGKICTTRSCVVTVDHLRFDIIRHDMFPTPLTCIHKKKN